MVIDLFSENIVEAVTVDLDVEKSANFGILGPRMTTRPSLTTTIEKIVRFSCRSK